MPAPWEDYVDKPEEEDEEEDARGQSLGPLGNTKPADKPLTATARGASMPQPPAISDGAALSNALAPQQSDADNPALGRALTGGAQGPGSRTAALMGQMPQVPHPKPWQRLLAGALGGAAGFANASAGRPGNMLRPIDPTEATAGIYGMGGYQAKLAQWQQQVKAAEYEDTLGEKAREADIRSKEVGARLGLTQMQMEDLRDQRKARAGLLTEQAQAKWQAGHGVASAPEPITQVNPIEEQDVSAQSLPGTTQSQQAELAPGWQGPQMPQEDPNPLANPQLPAAVGPARPLPAGVQGPAQAPKALTPGGIGPLTNLPPWAQSQYAPGSQAYSISTPEAKAQEAAGKAAIDSHVVTQEDLDLAEKTGFVAPGALGESVPNRGYANWKTNVGKQMTNQNKTVKPANVTDNEILMRSQGVQTGNPAADAIDPGTANKMWNQKKPQNTFNFTAPWTPGQTAAANTNPDPTTGRREGVLEGLPVQMRNKVLALVNYDAPITAQQLSPRKGQDNSWAQASEYAMAYDPKWRMGDWQQIQGVRKSFTSGPDGKNLASLNTLSGHIGNLVDDLTKMGNGDAPAFNRISNYLMSQFGAAQPNNAGLAATAVASELANALKGNATDTEIHQWANRLNTNMSPEQIQGAKQTLYDLMFRRLVEKSYQYRSVVGHTAPNIMSPDTAKVLQATGHDLSMIDPEKYKPHAGSSTPAGPAPGKIMVTLTDDSLKAKGYPKGSKVQVDESKFNPASMQKVGQ